jgi:hypothetical protein
MTRHAAATGYLALLLAALLACANGPGAGSDAAPSLEDKCGGKHVHASDCKPHVRAVLKDPDSAEFGGVLDAVFDTAPDCTQTYRNFVKAKNGFGAEVRTDFMCTYSPKTKAITFKVLR